MSKLLCPNCLGFFPDFRQIKAFECGFAPGP